MAPLRWGIASAGKISHDFATAVATWPVESHQLVAVAARSIESAKKFAEIHGIPAAYAGYTELANDPNVDIVYIGAINTAHFDIGMQMLNGGKHVLCEKPFCMNEKQAKRLLDHAKAKKLFCMEAVWSRFFPAYIHLRDQIKSGALGVIKQVDVEFGFNLAGIDRLEKKELGGGTILDLGIYTIQCSLWAFDAAPTEITSTGKLNEEGVDVETNTVLKFPGGGVANMKTSALKELKNEATIIGTKGKITLHQFWCPIRLTDVDGQKKEFPLPEARLKLNFINSAGLRYEAEEARRCINAGLLESPSVSHVDSLNFARIEDEIRRQLGVRFPEDGM